MDSLRIDSIKQVELGQQITFIDGQELNFDATVTHLQKQLRWVIAETPEGHEARLFAEDFTNGFIYQNQQ